MKTTQEIQDKMEFLEREIKTLVNLMDNSKYPVEALSRTLSDLVGSQHALEWVIGDREDV